MVYSKAILSEHRLDYAFQKQQVYLTFYNYFTYFTRFKLLIFSFKYFKFKKTAHLQYAFLQNIILRFAVTNCIFEYLSWKTLDCILMPVSENEK